MDGGRLWSDCGPWSGVVRRVRRSVLVSPSPLLPRNGGIGCGSRRLGRRARLRMAPLPVVPTYSRGLGGICGYTVCIVARRDFGCPFPGWYIPGPVLWWNCLRM